MVESRIVIPVVVGSSPISHPTSAHLRTIAFCLCEKPAYEIINPASAPAIARIYAGRGKFVAGKMGRFPLQPASTNTACPACCSLPCARNPICGLLCLFFQDFQHVIAGKLQLIERGVNRVRAGPPKAGSDNLDRHCLFSKNEFSPNFSSNAPFRFLARKNEAGVPGANPVGPAICH